MRRPWVRLLGWAAIVLSLALIGRILWTSAGQLRDLDWRVFVGPGVLGLGLYGVSLGLQAAVWTGLVSTLSLSVWSWRDVEVYFSTHLTRRLPGLPWYMGGRMIAYEKGSLRSRAALSASLIEWGGMLMAAGVWALVGYLQGVRLALALAGLVALVLAASRILSNWPRARKWVQLDQLRAGPLLLAAASYGVAWLLGGLILHLLVTARIPSAGLLAVTSAWAVSGVASMVMVFMPAGLGVRELTLTLVLGPQLGDALALVVALLIRILFALGDLIWGGAFWLLARSRSSHTP